MAWALLIIFCLYLLFSNAKGSSASPRSDFDERPLEDDMEDFLMMDYLSDEEINGH